MTIKRLVLSAAFLPGILLPGLSQTVKLDSLKQLLKKSPQADTVRIDLLNEIAYQFNRVSPDSSLVYANKAIGESNSSGYIRGEASGLNNLGSYFRVTGKYADAFEKHNESLKLFQQIHDRKGEASVYSNLGIIYKDQGNYVKAILNYRKSLDISEEIGNKVTLLSGWNNIGIVYRIQGNYQAALDAHRKSLKLADELKDLKGTSYNFNNIGAVNRLMGNLEEALNNHEKALEINQKIGDQYGIANTINNIGEIYLLQGRYPNALEMFKKCEVIRSKLEDKIGLANIYNAMARTTEKMGQARISESYSQKALAIANSIGSPKEAMDATVNLYHLFKNSGEIKKALAYLEQATTLHDSLFNLERAKQVADIEANQRMAQKDKEIELLNQAAEKDQKTRDLQRLINWIVSLALIIAVAFSWYAYRTTKKEKEVLRIIATQRENLRATNDELHSIVDQIAVQNEQLSKQAGSLQESNLTKNKLLAIIGHDLKGPLNSLNGLLNLLQSHSMSDEEFKQNAGKLSLGVAQVQFFLNNLLLWAGGQIKGIEAKPQKVDLYLLADRTGKLCQSMADEKKIRIDNLITPGITPWADEEHVNLILRNLLSNALKFTTENGLITMTASEAGNFVQISITDTGVGMSREQLDKLFKPRSSFSNKGTAGEKGTGLGLSLVHDFVNLNGGTISVDSTLGMGSTFTFTLPGSNGHGNA